MAGHKKAYDFREALRGCARKMCVTPTIPGERLEFCTGTRCVVFDLVYARISLKFTVFHGP